MHGTLQPRWDVHVDEAGATHVRSDDLARGLDGHEEEREVSARLGVLLLVVEHVAAERGVSLRPHWDAVLH